MSAGGETVFAGDEVRQRYREFIDSCRSGPAEFRLTPRSDVSPFSLCFGIFGLHLLQERAIIEENREIWHRELVNGLRAFRSRFSGQDLSRDKPYLQLLTFVLSALSALGTLKREPLADDVLPVLKRGEALEASLRDAGVFEGVPQTGNHAMFHAVLLIHAREFLGIDTNQEIDTWVRLHCGAMNRFGFWGSQDAMSHLQFQNGYHQYEILEFLGVHPPLWREAANQVAGLADFEGHFAPYPGGGGCYDYDAVFLLTGVPGGLSLPFEPLLRRTAHTIVTEQSSDGGFCESLRIRPLSVDNLRRAIRHCAAGRGHVRWERSRRFLSLLRAKHERIRTHWTAYSRGWSESNLWDSWFRMLTVARIEVALCGSSSSRWGFMSYPGIGFHPVVRDA